MKLLKSENKDIIICQSSTDDLYSNRSLPANDLAISSQATGTKGFISNRQLMAADLNQIVTDKSHQ